MRSYCLRAVFFVHEASTTSGMSCTVSHYTTRIVGMACTKNLSKVSPAATMKLPALARMSKQVSAPDITVDSTRHALCPSLSYIPMTRRTPHHIVTTVYYLVVKWDPWRSVICTITLTVVHLVKGTARPACSFR